VSFPPLEGRSGGEFFKATQSQVRAAFEKHEGETKDQVERLEQLFDLIKKPATPSTG